MLYSQEDKIDRVGIYFINNECVNAMARVSKSSKQRSKPTIRTPLYFIKVQTTGSVNNM